MLYIMIATLMSISAACAPIDPSVMNRMLYHFPSAACYGRPSGEPITIIDIKKTGVLYSPPFLQSNTSACPVQIESLFSNSSVLFHRPQVRPEYFRHRSPKAYYQFQHSGWADFPCSTIPTSKVTGESQLRNLLVTAIRGITRVRDHRCNLFFHAPDTIHLEQILLQQKIASAAINYLLSVAHANELCITL